MNKVQALYNFWSGFDLKAYDETHVPDGAALPYITYESATDELNRKVALTASLWYRSESWEDIELKQFEIAQFIGRGGVLVAYDGASVWVAKGSPWAQRMADSNDEMIRRIVLNVEVEFLD